MAGDRPSIIFKKKTVDGKEENVPLDAESSQVSTSIADTIMDAADQIQNRMSDLGGTFKITGIRVALNAAFTVINTKDHGLLVTFRAVKDQSAIDAKVEFEAIRIDDSKG